MRRSSAILLMVTASFFSTGLASAAPTIIEHVTLIDGTGRAPMKDMSVIVDGGHFTSVLPSFATAQMAGTRIDGRGKYLIPGLFDVHVHLAGWTKDAQGKIIVDRQTGLSALASYLYAGVTTILDCGNQPENILPLRTDERAGKIQAPHIFATGNAVTYPGSHGTAISILVDSWPQAKVQMEEQYDTQHPDVQKIMYDDEGWGSRPRIPILPKDLLQHIIEFYNDKGVRTVIHISNETRAREAIYSGVDALAHPDIQGPVTEQFVKLMAAKQTPMTSTLTIGDNYSRVHEHPEYLDQPLYAATYAAAERKRLKDLAARGEETALVGSEELYRSTWRKWMQIMTPIAEENIKRIDAAGGVVALGTDLSNGADSQRELELLAQAGIAPLEIIKIATFNSARLIGKQEQMGSIENGKIADAVLLSADPTANINNTKSIVFVMKAGQIIDESTLPLAGGKQPKRMH